MVIDLEKIKKSQETVKSNVFGDWLKIIRANKFFLSRITSKDKIFFVQNLQVMIKSGLPLDRSLRTLAEQTRNQQFKKVIGDLASGTEKGVAFADSLKKQSAVFGGLFVSMVEAGEASGRLEDVLKELYLQIKKLHELKTKIIAAMIYPLIVVTAMVGIGIGMMIFVVPKITSLFEQMKAQLPLATRVLIKVSNFVVENGILTFIAALLLVAAVAFSLKWEPSKRYWHALFLKLPVFGPIVKKVNLAKFARTLSSLIKTDIAIVKSFEITAQVLGNRLYRSSLLDSAPALKEGVSLTEVLKKHPALYPPVIVQMTAAGEETGSVDEVLGEMAGFYEDEVDQIMKTLPSIIEPLLILVLGAAVGVMAVAIIMPMYTLTQYIK